MYSIQMCSNNTDLKVPLFTEHIAAGFPSPASEYEEKELDFNELLVKRRAATYCLRVSGDSMTGAGILPGDILVVDRSVHPADGDIVVASLDGEFTVKRLVRTSRTAVLRAENPDYKDINVGEDRDFLIFGVVTGVVRTMRRGSV